MRIFFAILLLVVAVYALETEHFVITPDDNTIAQYLENAYNYYLKKGLQPAPSCDGTKYKVYIDPSSQYDAYTRFNGGCILDQRFKPGYTPRLVFHEVGHIFFEKYDLTPDDYFWPDEAAVEAMAAVATSEVYPEMTARAYYFVSLYFSEQLYRVNPFDLSEDRRSDWYKYSAAVAWYLQNSNSWGDLLKAFSTRQGAARLYVKFLLALAKGVNLGGVTYTPKMEVLDVSSGARRYPDLPGYTAMYYKISAPVGGVLRIVVEGGGAGNIVSNIAIGQDIVVENGTFYLALVNNSTETAHLSVVFYYTPLKISVVDGVYEGGRFSLRLYATYGFERISGVLKVNGSEVRFSDGFGFYNFTGPLRPYVLVVEYGNLSTRLYLNLSQPRMSVSPTVLYLDQGGRGVLNVTISNPNTISLACVLEGVGDGIAFGPTRVVAPSGSHTFSLPFKVSGELGSKALIRCGDLSTEVKVQRPSYSLDFDLDKGWGVFTVRLGDKTVWYNITKLPSDVSVYVGYVVLNLTVPVPELLINVSRPYFSWGRIAYTVQVRLGGPPWAHFRGTLRMGEAARYYDGNAVVDTILLNPGERKTVDISIADIRKTLELEAPRLESAITPLEAVVRGREALVLVNVTHNIILEGAMGEFKGSGFKSATWRSPTLAVVSYYYNDTITIAYSLFGEDVWTKVRLPKPDFSINLVRGAIDLDAGEFTGIFNITASVCNPSVDAKYYLEIGGRELVISARRGNCATNSTIASWRSPYRETVTFSVNTSLGPLSRSIVLPKPSVKARLERWVINASGEYAYVVLEVATPVGFTYRLMGVEVSGEKTINLVAKVSNGIATVNYKIGKIDFSRPRLEIEASPAVAEVNSSFKLNIEVRVPQGLYIDSNITTTLGTSGAVSLEPGVRHIVVEVPGVSTPGVYNVTIRLGSYANYTSAVIYRIENLSVVAPSIVPVGRSVEVRLIGRVTPRIAPLVNIAVTGCGELHDLVPINGSLTLKFDKACTAELRAYTNASKAVATITWASLRAEVSYDKLGILNGLPVFAAGSLSARALLGDRAVNASIRVVGFFDKLGLVNFTVYVEHMGVVNSTNFVGFAAPRDSYIAANKTAALLPPQSREYFLYLFQKAVATGDWELVDGISRLYSAPPTPFAVVARYLVERDLSQGRDPNIYAAEVLQRVEPFALGLAGGLTLALLRRLS